MSLHDRNLHELTIPIPDLMLVWNLYGTGYDNLGKSGKPETLPVPMPGPDQILVRIDSVGICFSDVKLIQQGETHPKLQGMDLSRTPTRPGHEVSITVVQLGEMLLDKFRVGQRFAIQPEVVHQGMKRTYGFNIPGGLTQYQLIGPELFRTDFGESLIEVDHTVSWAEASMLEPWGSVIAGYDLKNIEPKRDGLMWIIGNPKEPSHFTFSKYLDLPARILLTDVNPDLGHKVNSSARDVLTKDLVTPGEYSEITLEFTDNQGFDDIIVLEPQSTGQVETLINLVAPKGRLNLVGSKPLDRYVSLDVQRIHYDHINLVGNRGPEITTSYEPENNRRELKQAGIAVLFGGGGPIGQMHLQRAIKLTQGPDTICVVDSNQERLENIRERFEQTAKTFNTELHLINPQSSSTPLVKKIRDSVDQEWIDDAIVLFPDSSIMEEAVSILCDDGMINLFAGTPSGTFISIDLSRVYLGNLQVTGNSGLEKQHQIMALQLARQGDIDLNAPITAVGGMHAALDAIKATEERRFPGKIIIYPQLEDLPLLNLPALCEKWPSLKDLLNEGKNWSSKAEKSLVEIVLG